MALDGEQHMAGMAWRGKAWQGMAGHENSEPTRFNAPFPLWQGAPAAPPPMPTTVLLAWSYATPSPAGGYGVVLYSLRLHGTLHWHLCIANIVTGLPLC